MVILQHEKIFGIRFDEKYFNWRPQVDLHFCSTQFVSITHQGLWNKIIIYICKIFYILVLSTLHTQILYNLPQYRNTNHSTRQLTKHSIQDLDTCRISYKNICFSYDFIPIGLYRLLFRSSFISG